MENTPVFTATLRVGEQAERVEYRIDRDNHGQYYVTRCRFHNPMDAYPSVETPIGPSWCDDWAEAERVYRQDAETTIAELSQLYTV